MDNNVDTMEIKVREARMKLPEETRRAIDAVDWREAIVGMREKKGYNFEQLGDLEIETELLLSGILSPADYSRELEARMNITKSEVDGLVKEMNELVFSKIREELIKNTEKRTMRVSPQTYKEEPQNEILKAAGIEILPAVIPDKKPTDAISAQKLSGSFQIPSAKTNHSDAGSLSKPNTEQAPAKSYPKGADPYRLPPE